MATGCVECVCVSFEVGEGRVMVIDDGVLRVCMLHGVRVGEVRGHLVTSPPDKPGRL